MILLLVFLIAATTLRNVARFNNPMVFAAPRGGRAECAELFDTADRRRDRYALWLWNLRDAEYETKHPETKARVNGVPAPANAWPYTPSNGLQYWGTVRPPGPHLHRIDVV